MVKLSIIVPVYKVEEYIERCARSLMEQTLQADVEFLFINDCTPDASIKVLRHVLDEYPERKGQVRILENEKNLGVSATRKKGVCEATGTYIGWCDADDWCEKDMFEKMLNATDGERIDFIVCNYWEELASERKERIWEKCKTPQQCIVDLWKGFRLPGALWQQVCRKVIYEKSFGHITEVNYSEDVYVTILSCFYSSSISYVSSPLYHYNLTNTSSLVHNIGFTKEDWLRQKQNIDAIESILYKNGGYGQYHVACNALKFSRKKLFREAFPSNNAFYHTYRECYKDVNVFLFTPKKNKLKTFLVYNIYILFKLYKL